MVPNWRIGTKLFVLTVPLIVAATLLATWALHTLSAERLQEKLKSRANSIAHQVMADRQYYGSVVVPRVTDLQGFLGVDYRASRLRTKSTTFLRLVSDRDAEGGG